MNEVSLEDTLDDVIAVTYLYTRPKKGVRVPSIFMTEVICAIGSSFMRHLPKKLKKNTPLEAKVGAFILYSFEELGILEVVLGKSTTEHNAYVIKVLKDEAILELWATLPPATIQKLPSLEPYVPWVGPKHDTGAMIAKTRHPEILKKLKPENQPLVFEALNRSQDVGWRINRRIYDLHLWAFRNRAAAFNDIWKAHSQEARSTKTRETRSIGMIATQFLNDTFYHLYYLDFRGRKYCSTAYLNEQGSDLAKGLLLRDDCKPIGEGGFFWLCVSIASNWAGDAGRDDGAKTDKIPLKDRYMWVLDNEEIMVSYAASPKVNQGWMDADKPWQFLAACVELYELRRYQKTHGGSEDYSYESHLECFIDGTNNGSQHLSALTADEETAPHVNLVPSDLPGDLYMYVAHHMWAKLEEKANQMSNRARKSSERLIDNMIEMKKTLLETEPRSEARKEAAEKLGDYRKKHKPMIIAASPLFWLRIKDDKHKRKIVKRGTMTLPYGAKPYGLGEQIIDDSRKHGIDLLLYMEHAWGSYMGRSLFAVCEECLQRPMRLLSVFEQAGVEAEKREEFLEWTVPLTNFPVAQHYIEGKVGKFWIQYGPPSGKRLATGYFKNTYQLHISQAEKPIPMKGKQAQGAAPNIIHSLDAAHLIGLCCAAEFPVTTIHDSFGCLLADMPDLFRITREVFVELYSKDPFTNLLFQLTGTEPPFEPGNLDVSLVLDSEYAFS
ncbi:hypothetical protein N9112_00210 [bacterium]|nr:hypothetical protein [bacterium]